MSKYRKLAHAIYRCDYHVVFVPKYRYRVLTGEIAERVERDIRTLCAWRDVEVLELSVQSDHVHLACSIPPKISVSTFVGFLKGKLAIKLFRSYPGLKKKPYWGNHFWARGYFVTTFGVDAEIVRRYVRHQEEREKEDEEYQKGFDLFPER
ncbi:MAG TPA: IS200/IS605 family transposase [Burkholderiales bacterium]|nr:IS200/IS605 family transposase [Burkholderiales bacterium]